MTGDQSKYEKYFFTAVKINVYSENTEMEKTLCTHFYFINISQYLIYKYIINSNTN